MKKIYVILAAAAVVASCSQNEVLIEEPVQKNIAIGFQTFADKATRASGVADDHTTLQFFYPTFNVYGWKSVDNKANWVSVFNNVTNEYFASDAKGTVVYDGTDEKPSDEWGTIQQGGASWTGAWYYEGIRYWDKFATDYQFSAYAPIAASSQVTCTADGEITIGASSSKVSIDATNLMATPATALAYTGFSYDYMTAQNTYSGYPSPVELVFAHKLAKFNIKLALDEDMLTTQDVVVNSVKLLNLGKSSYYSKAAESSTGCVSGWYPPTDEATYDITPTDGYQLNGETAGTDNFDDYFIMEQLLMPQQIDRLADNGTTAPVICKLTEFEQACVYVKYTIGEEPFEGYYLLGNIFETGTSNTVYKFLGGNEYTLTITVGPEPIYFTCSVTPWTNKDGDITVW